MPDIFTKAKRSEVMSLIRGRGNKETEIALAQLFRAEGITGWRRHAAIVGRPDFAFWRQRVAVFVDGCFWHGCPKHCNTPVNNHAFWQKKLAGNQARDRRVTRTLRKKSWRVVRVWEHELRKPTRVLARIRRVLAQASQRLGM
jgi:DNA mismatch endonuclease (patch repair protein)